MDIFVELFSTFTGLLSLFVIVFMLGMAVFFSVWFMKNSKPPAKADRRTAPADRGLRAAGKPPDQSEWAC